MAPPVAPAHFAPGGEWSFVETQPLLAYMGEKDPAFAFGPPQAEAAGAIFCTVPDGIRSPFVNAEALLAVVQPFLTT